MCPSDRRAVFFMFWGPGGKRRGGGKEGGRVVEENLNARFVV